METSRSDTGAGKVAIQFNYDRIIWEVGTASGPLKGGLGGTSALAGYWTSASSNAMLPGTVLNAGSLWFESAGLRNLR